MSFSNTEFEKGTMTPSTNPSFAADAARVKQHWIRNIVDSFRQNPKSESKVHKLPEAGGFDHVGAARKTANSGLAHKLKSRHLQMIAIGGGIGTGLFVASGVTLSIGGPASLIIAYCILGILMYCTMQALGEMAVLYPVAGSFSAYSTRFLDPAWGFAMGWNYAMQWLIILPLEIVAATFTMSFWPSSSKVNEIAWVTIFFFTLVLINLFGVRGYGEAEFGFAIVKIVAVISFIILGIILNCGGGPDGDYIGGRYWKTNNVPSNYPGYLLGNQTAGSIASGAFNSGFKGLCSVIVTAGFSFTGTELVGLAAAEADNPRKSIPNAIKQAFWRICLFYIVSVIVIGLLVPYGDSRLLGKGNTTNESPFVIAINNAGIDVVPSLMNAVILVSVLSVGNTSIYGSSRTLAALADQGQAPRILSYIDRQGRPIVAILFSSAFGLICYVVADGNRTSDTIFKGLSSISGLSSIFTWGSICLAHIRYRAGWKAQGYSIKDITFRSQFGIIGSWIGFMLNCLILVAQFWTAVWPIEYQNKTNTQKVREFFRAFTTAPVVILFYVSYKLYFKTSFMSAQKMDLDTGRRDLDDSEFGLETFHEPERTSPIERFFKSLF